MSEFKKAYNIMKIKCVDVWLEHNRRPSFSTSVLKRHKIKNNLNLRLFLEKLIMIVIVDELFRML